MNRTLVLLFIGVLFGVSMVEAVNQECQDLAKISKNIKSSSILVAAKVNCVPNKNCSGLNCTGTFNKRKFRATVILQGCKEPVTLQINYGNSQLIVKNGAKTKLYKNFYAFTTIKKTDNIVTVSVDVGTCLTSTISKEKCFPVFPILKKKKIHINCGESRPTVPVISFPKPAKKANPECKGWASARSMIKRNFAIIIRSLGVFDSRPSDMDCIPSKDCSELRCTGYANNDNFTTSLFIDYCTSPVTMRIVVDVPKKKIHLNQTYKDGQKFKIINYPFVVHLKRIDNTVYVNISTSVEYLNYDIIKNLAINVDPSRCQGYHPLPPMSPHGQHCKSMIAMGKAIEKGIGNVSCSSIEKCHELQCKGIYGKERFTSVTSMNYCNSIPSMDMAITANGKNYNHTFKDGDIYKMPLPIKVGLKRMKNKILVNMSIYNKYILQNQPFIVDPGQCPSTVVSGKSKNLSGGAIAGIVVGIVIFIVILIVLIVYLVRARGLSTRITRYNNLAMSDDTDPLSYDFEPAIA